ncbi:sister chromatid cohesion protein 1 [Coemansia sp. RSA 1813]|nr:sister chromatid cohesion protein 1 [Coemansia sp. RSA 1843]KAJ2088912.1 sister chromatid cohesion protein 1 [Coemansia sp. RSA 986]KAJ2213933.1 sister chromatid cohesion protein 1 [Coemansia sp. RSA 487]KAJ2568757.1 sister chromatid cohesion protein 1 [Coemansia sp. RSA 1813]
MFYAEAILSKKGPLAKVWLAAHLERKLTKVQLLQASIPSSVGAIIGQDQGPPLALRLSGQLLLGVSRIYARKARYLLEDCNEALIRIRMAFRPGAADITSDTMVATHTTITLPEALTEFDILLPSSLRIPGSSDSAHRGGVFDVSDIAAAVALNTSRIQDITLAEQSFDISAVARGTGGDDEVALGEGDLLGRDDEFRLDLDEDFILSPLPQHMPEPAFGIDGSALEPEIGRDAMQRPDESMIDIQAEDLSLLGKGPGDGTEGLGGLADLTREELANVDGSGLLQFGNSGLLGMSRGLEDASMVPMTQEAALQEAEAEILAQRANQAKPNKRRRLNLSELVANETTSLSPDEIRSHLNDAADIMRMPTYLPASSLARLEDMSSAAIASRLLAPSNSTPFAALFAAAGPEAEQEVPAGISFDGSLLGANGTFDYTAQNPPYGGHGEPTVPEYEGMEPDEVRLEDGGDEIGLGGIGAGMVGEQIGAELLLADKSVEQLEQLEEESFQRQIAEQHHEGISLFATTLPVRDEDISLATSHLADQDIGEQGGSAVSPPSTGIEGATATGASGHSKNTIRAIHMLDSACKAENISVSENSSPREGASLSFANVTKGARRSDSVKLFFELLVLKTKDFVDVKQQAPFDDILIAPRAKLRRAAESIQVSTTHTTTVIGV